MSAFLKSVVAAGGLATGGPIREEFKQRWGIHLFVGSRSPKAHHWEVVDEIDIEHNGEEMHACKIRSACGVEAMIGGIYRLFEPGNFEYCQRCEALLLKKRGL